MEVKVYYPKKNKGPIDEHWDIKIAYHNKFPTVQDIENDYAELPIGLAYWSVIGLYNEATEVIPDRIFGIMNHPQANPMGTPEMQQWIRDNGVTHTSMSIGDIIKIDNEYHICHREGWKVVED